MKQPVNCLLSRHKPTLICDGAASVGESGKIPLPGILSPPLPELISAL